MKFIIVLATVVCSFCYFTNPVIYADSPDPGILYYNNNFYLVGTNKNSEGIFILRKSADLVNWEEIGVVFRNDDSPTFCEKDFWAPELHVVNGKVNVYFSCCEKGGQDILGVGVSKTGGPEGPYHPIGKLTGPMMTGIDAHYVQDRDTKKNYFVYRNLPCEQPEGCPIRIIELNEDGTKIIGTEAKSILAVSQEWEANVNEGPWIHYHEPYYYLFFSGNGYTLPGYAVGVARSKNLLGPYEKAAGAVMTQACDHTPSQKIVGPGHNSVVHIPTNNVDIMVYHAWINGKIREDPGRTVSIDKIWYNEDGWPEVGDGGSPSYSDLPDPRSEAFAQMRYNARLVKNSIVTIATYQNRDKCWNSNNATIDGDCNDRNNFYYVRTGLAGYGTFSLESVTKPGYFWRHFNGDLVLNKNDGSAIFKKDSSFFVNSGAKDSQLLSLRSYNFFEDFIRHQNGKLKKSWRDPKVVSSTQLDEDSTWRVTIQYSDESKMKFLES